MSDYYSQYENDALLDEHMAEQKWFPETIPHVVEHMHEQFAKYAAMTEEEKQADHDRLMATIDMVLAL